MHTLHVVIHYLTALLSFGTFDVNFCAYKRNLLETMPMATPTDYTCACMFPGCRVLFSAVLAALYGSHLSTRLIVIPIYILMT